ncbi:hypothetical protein HUU53_03695 [Candidatus Micrarchaeota archaeon]|nr:hypothetical protein [Candidatus Micrarchaeota archaeon]
MIDLQEVFYSALSFYGKENFFVQVKFFPYAGLKSTVKLKNDLIEVKVSDGFETASREVLFGLALVLLGKIFRRKPRTELIQAFKEFTSRKTSLEMHSFLRSKRGRVKKGSFEGLFFDLNELMNELFVEYSSILDGVALPSVKWSSLKSRRRLGWHDSSFNLITINKKLDSEKTPRFVVKAVLFHELLHCKHDILYQRGESMRRTVHTSSFKRDEEKFAEFKESEYWIRNYF